MSSLYIDQKHIALSADGARLKIHQHDKPAGSVPLNQIDRIITFCNTEMDTRVLASLAEHKVGFAAINLRKASRSVIVPGYCHNDIQRRLNQYHMVNDTAQCQRWANLLVLHKIKNQYRFLMHLQQQRADKHHKLHKAIHSLRQQIDRLLDDRTLDIDTLRGVEGSAANSYFQALTAVFAPALRFTGRNRRPPKDPVNACLSLAYTLLHIDAVLACHIAGLDPMLGIYHRPAFGRESLASDLIEPLRPRIDQWVWQLFNNRFLDNDHFHDNQGACLLGKAGRKHFYAEYEKQRHTHNRALKRIAYLLVKHLTP